MVSLLNDTLSNRAVGLLAFGMTRPGLDQVNSDSGGTVRRGGTAGDLAAQRLLVAVVDGEASRVQVVVEMGQGQRPGNRTRGITLPILAARQASTARGWGCWSRATALMQAR